MIMCSPDIVPSLINYSQLIVRVLDIIILITFFKYNLMQKENSNSKIDLVNFLFKLNVCGKNIKFTLSWAAGLVGLVRDVFYLSPFLMLQLQECSG